MGMKRQEQTVNSNRHVSPHELSTDCCGQSTNAAATLPSRSLASRCGEHRKIIPRTSFSPKKIWAKKKKWWSCPCFWPKKRSVNVYINLNPPPRPLEGFLRTACACDFRGVTFQVDLTSCHLSSDLKRGQRRGWQVNSTS